MTLSDNMFNNTKRDILFKFVFFFVKTTKDKKYKFIIFNNKVTKKDNLLHISNKRRHIDVTTNTIVVVSTTMIILQLKKKNNLFKLMDVGNSYLKRERERKKIIDGRLYCFM